MSVIDFRKPMQGLDARNAVAAREVILPPVGLAGIVRIPSGAQALVSFVDVSASSRTDPRNRVVAQALNQHGFATLLCDLLSPEEEEAHGAAGDVERLADRLCAIARWRAGDPELADLPHGFFAADAGVAVALTAAAQLGAGLGAIVSRGGIPDSAGLASIAAPTLLIVGSLDVAAIGPNQQALARLKAPKAMEIIPGASHFFAEPGALTAVTTHAQQWFARHLSKEAASRDAACCNG